jgi:hypothetical protein
MLFLIYPKQAIDMGEYNENDLELLIGEKLDECSAYPALCRFKETPEGRKRVLFRVKELILTEGITNIESAIAKVDDELRWGVEDERN